MLNFAKSNSDFSRADIILLGVNYGASHSYRDGSDKGPEAIIDCFDNNMEIFDRFTRNVPYDLYEYTYFALENINEQNPEQMVNTIAEFYELNHDKPILMIGGNHAISIGAFKYFSRALNPQDITILQIDAHPDLRDNTDDYKEGASSIDHACTMRRGHEMGFKTVQVGIRTYSIYDFEYITQNNLTVFEWGRGYTPQVSDIIDAIRTEKVYLTLDIDGIDPAHAPATGTPVPGGLSWEYISKLIRELTLSKTVIGADVVEVAPFDDDVLTQYTAAHLCYNIASYKIMKDKGVLHFFE